MKLKTPKLFLIISLFVNNSIYANQNTENEISISELDTIKANCLAKNSSHMDQIRGFGKFNIQSEWLLRFCINNAIEIKIYNNDNLNKNVKEVYETTFFKIQDRINYLQNFDDNESQVKLKCFQNLNNSMYFSVATKDPDFIKRALISYYMSAKNDCVKRNYY
ncbi:hypothetical protein ACWNT8_14500 [Pigmentibacter ruber]|uniref:hypothetical protein n=1 Tax=Pigmentibacter ruber TaxID=2683196 RepID=UPI00131E35C8|nr:hypothetical protein [Pigmentibacter ruber]BFD31475.1 hypothetical protein GTC16762_10930 [Pigmentibacter ruber]